MDKDKVIEAINKKIGFLKTQLSYYETLQDSASELFTKGELSGLREAIILIMEENHEVA
jgi:hypothetical protein